MSPEAVIFGSSTLWRPDTVPQDQAWRRAVLQMCAFQHSLGSLRVFIVKLLHWRVEVNQTRGPPEPQRASSPHPESSALLREGCVQKLSPLGVPLCLGAGGQSG